MAEKATRYAVVTGSNKGLGFGIARQLASKGIITVLTARDEKRGVEAVEKLKEFGLSNPVVFHQLDVTDPASITSLADFVKTQFGKLDILVNNAGVCGTIIDGQAFKTAAAGMLKGGSEINFSEIMTQTFELAEECVKTNYYGTKQMTEALIPLLQLSESPKVLNISSRRGLLKFIPNEWAKGVLSDADNLTEEGIDEVLQEFLRDFREDMLETKGWPSFFSAYTLSKASLNAYTRVFATKYPSFCANCVHPGFVITDATFNVGVLTIDEAAENVLRLTVFSNDNPSGLFFSSEQVSSF